MSDQTSVAFMPVPHGIDETARRISMLESERVTSLLADAASRSGKPGIQARTCLELLGELSESSVQRFLEQPVLRAWTAENSFLSRCGRTWDTQQSIAEISAMIAIAAAVDNVSWRAPLILSPAGDGTIHFGTAGQVVCSGPIICTGTAGEILCTDLAKRSKFSLAPQSIHSPEGFGTVLDGDIEIGARHPRIHRLFRRANESARVGPYPKKQMKPVERISESYVKLLDDTLNRIGSVWPEILEELRSHIRLIVPFNGVPLGFTDIHMPGALFIKHLENDFAFAAEHLIHEASHSRLNAINYIYRLWPGTQNVMLSSPWRRDPRPLSGVYHGAFVFARLLVFIDRCGSRYDLGPLAERAPRIADQFWSAYHTLENRPELSHAAQVLLHDMTKAVAECVNDSKAVPETI